MNNIKPTLHHALPLTLWHKNKAYKIGFCISNKDFSLLEIEQDTFLYQNEKDYYATLRFPKRQQSYLIGRYCAKQAIRYCLNEININQFNIKNGIFQQPVVQGAENVQVSISHAEDFGVAIAFSETCPMGIDIEVVSKHTEILAHLTMKEQQLANKLFISEDAQLILLWSIKEALSKTIKCGLMIPFELLEILSITQQENRMFSYFKNFHQYQALSFFVANKVCSIVYPKDALLDFDVKVIQDPWQ